MEPHEKPVDLTAGSSRRLFLGQSASSLAGVGTLMGALPTALHAASGDSVLRLGLVGCGGRGSGAIRQALTADPNTRLVAMADAFESRLTGSLSALKNTDVASRVDVDQEHQFVGLDAYKQLLATDVDVVLLTTPPAFRPVQMQAAVDAGKHVFAEKPVAVDAAGVRSVLETTRQAQEKRLFIVAGLQTRYEPITGQMVERIQDGAIGDIVAMRTSRFGSPVRTRSRRPEMTDVAYQVSNWGHFTWLSGDFIVEQFVHELDRIAWVIGSDPVSCMATGGRQTRIGPDTGHIYDHFSAVFKYANGAEFHATTRQQRSCQNIWEMELVGTRGRCTGEARTLYTITGPRAEIIKGPRARRGRAGHQLEHDAMYAALRRGDYINNGDYAARSTMMGIMARDSAYSGREVNWQEQLAANDNLVDVDNLTWKSELPDWKVAMPGLRGIV